MEKRTKLTLLSTFLLIGLIPLCFVSFCLSIASIKKVNNSLRDGTYDKLRSAAVGMEKYYWWDLVNTGEVAYDHDYVDCLLDQDIELTLFLKDTRHITSLKNENGERNEGTKADPEIYKTVMSGKDYMASDVDIAGTDYFVYYVPLHGANDEIVGMAFAGEKQSKVDKEIKEATINSVIIATVLAFICVGIVVFVSSLIRKKLAAVIDAIEVLADGDLNVSLNQHSKIREINTLINAAQKLQSNMQEVISNVMSDMDGLDSNMGQITHGVDVCNRATEGIVAAADELAKGSMEMAESVQVTAANMVEMGDRIAEIEALASSVAGASAEVLKESRDAKKQLGQLIVANRDTADISNDVVNGINESAAAVENIRSAADVIAQIASQTSLLALNASIEAARAGEAGKGFAVVATEISNLATQSNESTEEIQKVVSEIIMTSEANVENANKIKLAVDKEGDVLARVNRSFDVVDNKIGETTRSVETISDMTKVLHDAKDSILDEISNLSSISEQNAASCQETNANMEELGTNVGNIQQQAVDTREVSNQLRGAVSYFKI